MAVIIITGASTGSDRMIAGTLASNGYFVYAGARKDKDLQALDAIVNNAGVGLMSPLIDQTS